jgi:hypothetical protein
MRWAARQATAFLIAALTGPAAGQSQTSAGLHDQDRERLAEAFRLADAVRAAVWPGWEHTPMPVLFVADSAEFLIGHPAPTPEFSPLGNDALLGREVHTRPRQFPPTLLATFPAVAGRSTIVVGSAARTGKSPAEWVVTLLHEHFHQWQSALPDYYARAAGLGLARGDTTGRWMLDYPFPYDSAPVQRAVKDLAASLNRALNAQPRDQAETLRALTADRDRLRRIVSSADYRYVEFQLWQEGVPRFVELAVAEAAGRDQAEYRELAERMRRKLGEDLEEMSLGRDRRVSFYALGAGLATLLQRIRSDWKTAYERHPFALAELVTAGP